MKTIITTALLFASFIVTHAQITELSNGKVGIGTVSPQQNLSIKATRPRLALLDVDGDAGVIEFHESPNQIRFQKWSNSGDTFDKNIMTLNADNGNVGIGTVSPQQNLSIKATRPRLALLGADGDAGVIEFHDSPNQIRFQKWSNSGSTFDKNIMTLNADNGNVGIGTVNPGNWKLAVNGEIRAKEIKVETGWSDFVFYDDYKLPTLKEVENHIKEKRHLKDIPSAKEVEENGIFLGEMDSKLLQKIEELTLYTIQQEKQLTKQQETNKTLEIRLAKLESILSNKQ